MSDIQGRASANRSITSQPVEEYLKSMVPERDSVLAEIEAQAAKRRIPIVGPVVGQFLYQLAKVHQARTVFEMGSAVGYSTIWWARAVGEKGRVVYTDGDPRNAEEARRYFDQAGVGNRVEVLVGDALELLSARNEHFDIIFNDVDKEDYPRVPKLALPRLRPGGLFITDNVLWRGAVASNDPRDSADVVTSAIREFNRALCQSPELITTIIPLRDGVSIALKI